MAAQPSRKWYKRRRLLQFAGISAATFILPGAMRAAIHTADRTSPQFANNIRKDLV